LVGTFWVGVLGFLRGGEVEVEWKEEELGRGICGLFIFVVWGVNKVNRIYLFLD